MSEVQSPKSKVEEIDTENSEIIEGEVLEIPSEEIVFDNEEQTKISPRTDKQIALPKDKGQPTKDKVQNQKNYLQYIFLPLIFLTVTLLGGLRLDAADSALIFLKPPLICLIFAVILLVLFFRSNLLNLEGWFSEMFSTLRNIANGVILITLFFASTQIFNSLLPRRVCRSVFLRFVFSGRFGTIFLSSFRASASCRV